MIVAVTGSRTWRDQGMITAALVGVTARNDFEIEDGLRTPGRVALILGDQRSRDPVTGTFYGADWLAQCAAIQLGLSFRVLRADWKKHGKAAGPIRNRAMLDQNPELLLAFWDGSSRGTKDMIDEARRRGIQVQVCNEAGPI